MDTSVDTRQFRFGAIVHQDYQELAFQLADLEDKLNAELNLADYTDGVEVIYFVPIVVPEQSRGEYSEESDWNPESKTLVLKLICEPRFSEMSKAFHDQLEKQGVLPKELSILLYKLLSNS